MKHAQPQAIIVAATVTACTSLTFASIIDLQWVGPAGGLWHNTAHWDPDTIPNNGGGFEYHAIISNARSGALVNLGSNATVSNLTIGGSDHLRIADGNSFTLTAENRNGGVINNAGLLEINSVASTTNLYISGGEVALTGGGTLQLNSSTGHIRRNGALGSLLNVDNVIRGVGNLSGTTTGTRMDIINQHVITADVAGGTLHIDPTSTQLFTNEGVLRAENGGILRLNAGPYLNVGGVIEALAGSQVSLSGVAEITGGELTTAGTGVIRAISSTPRLIDLTNSGNLIVNNGVSLQLEGDIENTGDIELASVSSTTNLHIMDSMVSLTGGGTVHLNSSTAHIRRNGGNGSLLNVDNLIRGVGNLSGTTTGTRMDITNQHLITADVDGGTLNVDPTAAQLFTNEGTLRAENGGILRLNTGPYLNVGGVIEALDGSQVSLSGVAEITGGELTTAGTGVIRAISSTPRLIDLTNSGNLIVNNGVFLQLEGDIENTGDIELASVSSTTELNIMDSVVSLTGGGTVHLNSSTACIRRNGGDGSLLNVDNLIRGVGNLSGTTTGTRMDITNQHMITADVDGGTLNVDPTSNQLFTNEGVLRAESGGILRLNAGPYFNVGGVIEALDGSQVSLSGTAVVTGGEITTDGSGVIRVISGNPRLVDLTNSGNIVVNNGNSLDLEGAIHNTGDIELASVSSTTNLYIMDSEVALTGGGTIHLNSSTAYIRRNGGDGSLLNVDNVIRGRGEFSGGSTGTRMDITNHGTILADSDDGSMFIYGNLSGTGFTNAVGGLVHVTGLGGLQSTAPGFTNAGGQVTVDAGRTLSRASHYDQTAGTTTVNGTLVVTGSGNQLRLQGGLLNGNGQINGTLRNTAGVINPGQSTDVLTVNGTFMQSGAGVLEIEINGDEPIDDHDVLNVNGTAQLGGVLRPVFDDNLPLNVGDEWTVLLADVITGTFTGVLPCVDIRVRYENDTVIVEYTGITKIGDLNCDGVVDVDDLFILLSMWGDCADPDVCPADLNNDEVVDVDDLFMLLAGWG